MGVCYQTLGERILCYWLFKLDISVFIDINALRPQSTLSFSVHWPPFPPGTYSCPGFNIHRSDLPAHQPIIGNWLHSTWQHSPGLSVQFSSVTQLCPTLCDPMNHTLTDLPVHHQLLESTQTHVHWVSDAIQPSHPLSSPSPSTLNLLQHQGLFKWVSSLHQVGTCCEELTHWKRPYAGKDWRQEEKGMTGWDGWMASPTRWTWVWASSRS